MVSKEDIHIIVYVRRFIHSTPYLAWTVVLISTVGSLYASEIAHFPPCVLCWYQRICMYPIVLILAIGIVKKDKFMPLYVLSLSIIGFFIALYHSLLYYKIIPESLAPCIQGISCSTKYIGLFGFIDIPLLSLTSFGIITILMLFYWYITKAKK